MMHKEQVIETILRYYVPNVKKKDYNVMIDGKNVLDQPVKNEKVTNENIRKIATGQGDDYTTVVF